MKLFPSDDESTPPPLPFFTDVDLVHRGNRGEIPKMPNSSVMKKSPKNAQLTLFYNGHVYVFDEFPAERMQNILSFANQVSSFGNKFSSDFTPISIETSSDFTTTDANTLVQQHSPSSTLVQCDLPTARNVSVRRFLERRNNRNTQRSPNQTSNAMETPQKPIETTSSWLQLAAKSSPV